MNDNNFSFDDGLNDQQFNNNIDGDYFEDLDDGGPQTDRPLFQKQKTQNNKKSVNKYLEGGQSKSLEHQEGNSSSLNNFDSNQLMDLPNVKSQSKFNPIQFNNNGTKPSFLSSIISNNAETPGMMADLKKQIFNFLESPVHKKESQKLPNQQMQSQLSQNQPKNTAVPSTFKQIIDFNAAQVEQKTQNNTFSSKLNQQKPQLGSNQRILESDAKRSEDILETENTPHFHAVSPGFSRDTTPGRNQDNANNKMFSPRSSAVRRGGTLGGKMSSFFRRPSQFPSNQNIRSWVKQLAQQTEDQKENDEDEELKTETSESSSSRSSNSSSSSKNRKEKNQQIIQKRQVKPQSESSFESVDLDIIEDDNPVQVHIPYKSQPSQQQDKHNSSKAFQKYVDDSLDKDDDFSASDVMREEEILVEFPNQSRMPYTRSLLLNLDINKRTDTQASNLNMTDSSKLLHNKDDQIYVLDKFSSSLTNMPELQLKQKSSKMGEVVDQYIKLNKESIHQDNTQQNNFLKVRVNSLQEDHQGLNRLTTLFSVTGGPSENNQDNEMHDHALIKRLLADNIKEIETVQEEENQKKQRDEQFERIKDEIRINDEDLEREIYLEQKEEQDEQEEDPFESHFFNIFNVILSFLFVIMIMTECDFSSQQKISTIMVRLFDQTAYDNNDSTRQSIVSGDDIYIYMRDLMLPMIFDEPTKITASNPYITDVQYLRSLENETTHFINNFNYFVGLRVTYKRKSVIKNSDKNTYKVLPSIMPERFTIESADYPDYREPLKVKNSSKIYYHQDDGGAFAVGGFTEILLGNKTFKEAQSRLEDMKNAGWFEDDNMLYFGVEIMTYNINYKHAGFYIFQHVRDITGFLNTEPGRFYTIYPTLYDDKSAIILIHHFLVFTKTKHWGLQWYYYLDILIFFFSSYSLYFWFQNLATRGEFKLPFQSEQEFEYWNENQYFIRSFLQVSPIAVIFLCFKNLQIFSVYFPAFGVLFDTIKKSKNNALSFFIMSIILSFGFIIAGMIMFGNWIENYNSIQNSSMSLFFIMMTQAQTEYTQLEESNAIGAPLYFYPAAIMFQIILINMFLTLILTVYEGIRSRKQLESEAIAKILVKEYTWNLKLWTNFLFCRVDRRSKEEFFLEDEEDQVKKTKLKQQLFGKKEMKTKEKYEEEILQNKKKILRKKKIDIINRILKFKTVDASDLQDLKQATIYFFYIIIFVTLILLQLNIVNVREATKPMRVFMEGGKFEHDVDTQSRLLQLISQENLNDTQTEELHRILESTDSGGDSDEDNVYGAYQMKSSLYDIYSSQDIESWLLLKFYKYLYYNAINTGQFVKQNYFFGPIRMRMTLRQLKFHSNLNPSTNSTIKASRNQNSYSPDSEIDENNEIISNFYGSSSKKLYNYTKPGTVKSYAQKGGFVFYFSNETKQALSLIRQIYSDKLIEEKLSTLVLEIDLYTLPEKDSNDQEYLPSCFDKYCQHLGINFEQHKHHHIFYFLLLNIYFIILWLIRLCFNIIKAFMIYIDQGVFHILSFGSVILSNYLTVIWVKIIVLLYLDFSDNGSVRSDTTDFLSYYEKQTANYIDVFSYIVYLMESYVIVASINALINFFRIFQFFQFSIKLSVFTEILKDSKNDILYFLAMFLILLLGYAVMGSAYYGENLKEYSDLLQTVIELFQLMITFFEYETFAKYSTLTPLFFISFMIFFTMFLLSMLVAIIIAHYAEYEEQQVLIKKSMSNEDNNFFKLMFLLMRQAVAPDEYATSKNRLKQFWYRSLMKIEKFLTKQNIEVNFYEKEIRDLKNQLSSKYKRPQYSQFNEIHQFLRPYLQKNENQDYIRTTAQNNFDEPLQTEKGEDIEVNLGIQKDFNVELLDGESQPKKKIQLYDKNINAINFRELKIGVIQDFANENDNDMLAQSSRWLAALEDELFTISNFKILYTELLEHEDNYSKEEFVKIYDVQEFNSLQASFLAALTLQDQIQIWRKAKIEQKYQIWEILDFNKLIADQNKIQSDDTLEDFFDFVCKTKYNLNIKQRPILTFKKVNRSPEYQNAEYSRASNEQRDLWKNHTSQKEKFQLWFYHFNSYYRTKLWNKLQFSEDYALNFCNTQQLSRQDLVIFVLEKLDDVRHEYIEYLMRKYEKLLIRKQKVINLQSNVPQYRKVIAAIKDVEEKLINVTQRKLRLQEILKIVPDKIKDRHISPEFYIKIWEIIKEREYEEIQPLTGLSIIDTIRKVKSGVINEENTKVTKKKKEKQNNGLTIIDQFDVEESKDLRPKHDIKQNGLQTPNIFSPHPEKAVNLMDSLGINVNKIIRSQLNSKMNSRPASRQLSRRNSVTDRASTAEPRTTQLDSRQGMTSPLSILPGIKKVVHFQNHDWLGRPIETDNYLNTDDKFLATSPPHETEKEEDIENAKPKNEILQPPKLFAKLSLTLKTQALNQKSRFKKRSILKPLHKSIKIKLSKAVHLKAMKRMFQLMIGGVDGELLTTMNKKCKEKVKDLKQSKLLSTDTKKAEKIDKFKKYFKYKYVLKHQVPGDERMALWLPLSLEQKMMMISAQHIESEAEMLEMLLLEEIDWFGKGIYKLEELDKILERGLDNLIYEKYQKLTDKQTLDMIQQNVERVRQKQMEQDLVLLKYMAFLEEKQRMIGISADLSARRMKRLKDDNKRIEERIKWNKQFNEKNRRQSQFQPDDSRFMTQKTSPFKYSKKDKMR
eukprot:403352808